MRWMIILISLVITMGSKPMEIEPETVLWEMFSHMGAKQDQITLHHGGRLPRPMRLNQSQALIQSLGRKFGLSALQIDSGNEAVRFSMKGLIHSKWQMEIHLMHDQTHNATTQPYLMVQIEGFGNRIEELLHVRKLIESGMQTHEIIPTFHISIQGSRPLSKDSTPSLSKIFQQYQAKEIESIRTERLVSISAYTPKLSGGMRTKGGYMNLQVATRINQDTNRQMVTLGTPIITIEY